MPTLQNHRGQPLVDADGQEIKAGSIVVDAMFDQGIARGTIPLEHGDGVNVCIDWLGPKQDLKQPVATKSETT